MNPRSLLLNWRLRMEFPWIKVLRATPIALVACVGLGACKTMIPAYPTPSSGPTASVRVKQTAQLVGPYGMVVTYSDSDACTGASALIPWGKTPNTLTKTVVADRLMTVVANYANGRFYCYVGQSFTPLASHQYLVDTGYANGSCSILVTDIGGPLAKAPSDLKNRPIDNNTGSCQAGNYQNPTVRSVPGGTTPATGAVPAQPTTLDDLKGLINQ